MIAMDNTFHRYVQHGTADETPSVNHLKPERLGYASHKESSFSSRIFRTLLAHWMAINGLPVLATLANAFPQIVHVC